MKIANVDFLELRASHRSTWSFVQVTDDDGRVGTGETTIHRDTQLMGPTIRHLAKGLEQATDPMAYLDTIPDPDDFVDATARSGLNQALTDLAAQRSARPIWRLQTDKPAASLQVYANINRRTTDRSAEGFKKSAREAASNGISSVKIAPFDGLTPGMSVAEARPFLDSAFARIFAVREAIGDARLMIDCHWRLNEETFRLTLDVAERAKLFWIECPYPEEPAFLGAIRKARGQANARAIRLAGLELKLWPQGFSSYLEHGCYDVVMPDIKHAGGYSRFYALASAARHAGVEVAPHNPTGPICHAHSVMASSAIENFLILEMQFDETRAFRDIVDGDLPMQQDGMVERVDLAGLGLRLDPIRIEELVQTR